MAINYPKGYALGSNQVREFPAKQYEKITEIIDKINEISVTSGTLIADTISEKTTATGVTIDGLLIKDNAIVNASAISSSGVITSAIFADGVQTLSGPGAISITKGRTEITTTGADAFTLANATDGFKKSIYMVVDGGDGTITPTGLLGFSTIKFTAVGQGVELVYSSSQSKWVIVGNNGATLA